MASQQSQQPASSGNDYPEEKQDAAPGLWPYRNYVESLLDGHHHLKTLHQFMSSEEWQKWADHGHPKWQGITKFDIHILDIEKIGPVHDSGPLHSAEALDEYLAKNPPGEKTTLRLFLAEDLSARMIEYFGARFRLDPNAFEAHLRDHERLRSGRPLLEYLQSIHPSPLPRSRQCAAKHFTASFYRPYQFDDTKGGNPWKAMQKKRWEAANVIRSGVGYGRLHITDAMFLQERFTVCYVPSEDSTAKTCLIIFDPFLPMDAPRTMGGYRNVIDVPPFNPALHITPSWTSSRTHRALRMDFIDWLNSHDPKQLSTEAARFGEHDVSFLAYLFQVARANGQDFIRESRDVIGYIEVKLHSFWRFKGGELDEETVPDCLQMLRYFIIDVQEVTKSTIAVMKGRFARPEVDGASVTQHHTPPNECELIIKDFEDLEASLNNLRHRAETDIEYFAARVAAKEVKKSQYRTQQLTLLNYAVFLLGPISALSTILAVQDRGNYTIVFIVCSAAALLVLVVSRLVSGTHLMQVVASIKHLFVKEAGEKIFDFFEE